MRRFFEHFEERILSFNGEPISLLNDNGATPCARANCFSLQESLGFADGFDRNAGVRWLQLKYGWHLRQWLRCPEEGLHHCFGQGCLANAILADEKCCPTWLLEVTHNLRSRVRMQNEVVVQLRHAALARQIQVEAAP